MTARNVRPALAVLGAAALGFPAAAARATPPDVPVHAQRICQLTGDAPNGGATSNWTDFRNHFYGTDLGFPVQYRGRTYFFFGDTWDHVPTSFHDVAPTIANPPYGTPGHRQDDVMAWTVDTTPENCLSLRSVVASTSLTAAVQTTEHSAPPPFPMPEPWQPITPVDSAQVPYDSDALYTPGPGFVANDRLYTFAWVHRDSFTPLEYFVLPPNDHTAPFELLRRSRLVLVEATGTGARFVGDTVVTGTRFLVNFTTVEHASDAANLYVMARSGYGAGFPLVLMRHSKATISATAPWNAQYFANGNWVAGEWNATALQVEPGALPFASEPSFMHFSVQWVPMLGRYVMLYSAPTWDPNAAPDPNGLQWGLEVLEDQVFARTATSLEGPWSDRVPVFNGVEDGGYCNYMRVGADAGQRNEACGASNLPSSAYGQTTPSFEARTGFVYGVQMLPASYVQAQPGNVARIYFNMSVFNPYQVMLMKVDVGL